jgi:exosortase H (IPTLxxWG-CTERM-specific)
MEKSPELGSPAPPAAPPFARRSIVRFVSIFAVCVAAYYALSGAALFRESLFPAYLRLNARMTAACLHGLGQSVKADDTCVFSPKFMLTVERGCDAIEPTVLLIAAILASPVPWRPKILGLIAGPLALAVINVLRLITLYLTGIYWPAAFEVMHVDVWQAIFIFLALLLWIVWALWALKPRPVNPDAAA